MVMEPRYLKPRFFRAAAIVSESSFFHLTLPFLMFSVNTGFSIRESPQPCVEGAVLFSYFLKAAGVADDGIYLAGRPDHSRRFQDLFHPRLIVRRNFFQNIDLFPNFFSDAIL